LVITSLPSGYRAPSPENQRNYEESQEDYEQNLGKFHSDARDSDKAQEACYESQYQEEKSPVQHGTLSFLYAIKISTRETPLKERLMRLPSQSRWEGSAGSARKEDLTRNGGLMAVAKGLDRVAREAPSSQA
jgi:hypothetical protein